MLVGAGLLGTINLLGSWVMRRLRERQYPDHPVDYPQVALALALGLWAGPLWGVLAGLASVGLNLAARRPLNPPEWLTLGSFVGSLALIGGGLLALPGAHPDTLSALLAALRQGLEAAGGMALLAGLYWWLSALRAGRRADPLEADTVLDDDQPSDPVAMGFGDVKLAAAIGAFIGAERFVVALMIAVLAGAVLGVIQRLAIGENRLKFGPYLALGGLLALVWGEPLLQAYLGALGLN
jgi:leader peptidase (prepilin peptidase) / N-methyltransferase